MPSELDAALRRFRTELLQNERRAASAMVRAYGESWVRLSGQIATIQRELEGVNDPALTFRLRYLQAVRQQIAAELAQFAALAESSTLVTQQAAVYAALNNAATLADIVSGGGVQGFYTRPPTEAIENLVGFASDGSPLNEIFSQLFDYADDVTDLFASSLAAGLNPRETAALLRRAYGTPLVRALLIARTETLRAYREATWQSYQTNSDIISGWIWISAADRRACVSCISMHGSRHRLDERLDDHPNGRCVMAPIVRGFPVPDIKPGAERFAELSEEDQLRVMGPAMLDAWRDGLIKLRPTGEGSPVGRRKSKQWGTMRYAKSLKAIIGADRAAQYGKK
jgi:SPP1 gp7 family putative phage head morphogenesis protein